MTEPSKPGTARSRPPQPLLNGFCRPAAVLGPGEEEGAGPLSLKEASPEAQACMAAATLTFHPGGGACLRSGNEAGSWAVPCPANSPVRLQEEGGAGGGG